MLFCSERDVEIDEYREVLEECIAIAIASGINCSASEAAVLGGRSGVAARRVIDTQTSWNS